MMIGPDPMTRIRLRSVRFGIQQLVDDIYVRLFRRPARVTRELRRRADQGRDVRGTSQRGLERNLSRRASLQQDVARQLYRVDAYTARDVVYLANAAAFGQRKIRTHDVVDVQIITDDVIANHEGGRAARSNVFG